MLESSFIAGVAALIASLGIVAILIALIIPITLYCLSSYGRYTMALQKNIDYPWLAWVPVIKLYILGEIIDEKVCISTLVLPYAQIVLPIVSAFGTVIATIPFIGWLIAIAVVIYNWAAYYRLYRLYTPDSAVLYLVISIIFPFMLSIFPFIIRKKTPAEYQF